MTKTWQRQAIGLAAGACLLSGISAVQAAPVASGLIDLGGLTITNGQSQDVDFNGDGSFDFNFSINDGVISFSGFGNNRLATNGSGGAVGVGRGGTAGGQGSGDDFEFVFDDPATGDETTIPGEQTGTLPTSPVPEEVLLALVEPDASAGSGDPDGSDGTRFIDYDIGEDANGDPTLTLVSSTPGSGDTGPAQSAFDNGPIQSAVLAANLPEPGAALLLLGGLIGLGAYRRRKLT